MIIRTFDKQKSSASPGKTRVAYSLLGIGVISGILIISKIACMKEDILKQGKMESQIEKKIEQPLQKKLKVQDEHRMTKPKSTYNRHRSLFELKTDAGDLETFASEDILKEISREFSPENIVCPDDPEDITEAGMDSKNDELYERFLRSIEKLKNNNEVVKLSGIIMYFAPLPIEPTGSTTPMYLNDVEKYAEIGLGENELFCMLKNKHALGILRSARDALAFIIVKDPTLSELALENLPTDEQEKLFLATLAYLFDAEKSSASAIEVFFRALPYSSNQNFLDAMERYSSQIPVNIRFAKDLEGMTDNEKLRETTQKLRKTWEKKKTEEDELIVETKINDTGEISYPYY